MKQVTYTCNLCASKNGPHTGLEKWAEAIHQKRFYRIKQCDACEIHICQDCYTLLEDLFQRESESRELKHA